MFPILFLIVFIFLASFAYAAVMGAPWVPIKKGDTERLIVLLNLQPGQSFIELGCGDGRVCLEVARRTGAHVTGVELSLAQWLVASVRGTLSPSQQNKESRHPPLPRGGLVGFDAHEEGSTRFLLANAFHADISKADAVYLFLMPDTYAKIQPKFEKELKPGAKVVSYAWPIPGWQASKIDEQTGRLPLYLYER